MCGFNTLWKTFTPIIKLHCYQQEYIAGSLAAILGVQLQCSITNFKTNRRLLIKLRTMYQIIENPQQ